MYGKMILVLVSLLALLLSSLIENMQFIKAQASEKCHTFIPDSSDGSFGKLLDLPLCDTAENR